MAASAFQTIGSLQSHGYLKTSGFHQEIDGGSVRLTPKSLKLEFGLSKKGCYPSGARKCGVIQASNSQIYVVDPVLSPTNKNAAEPWKKSSKFVLS